MQQSLPFRLAADHGSRGGLSHGRRLGDPSYLAGVNGEHALVDSLGGRTGINSQLVSQNRGARVIDAQRTGPIAHGEMQKHQLAVDGLVQRVSPYQSLCVSQRFFMVVLLLQQRCQPLQGVQVRLAQPLALRREPLVVPARQQVSAIQTDCCLQRSDCLGRVPALVCGLRACGLEVGHIQAEWGV